MTPTITIQDDGTTAVNQLPITITTTTSQNIGTLDDLNSQLANKQKVLSVLIDRRDNYTAQFQAQVDQAQADVDNTQKLIDSVNSQLTTLTANRTASVSNTSDPLP